MNLQFRLENANKALAAYETSAYPLTPRPAETDDIITDLLTDLMHYCAQTGIDFCEQFEKASLHFDYESRNEP